MEADDPEDSTLIFHDSSKRQTSEYEIVKHLRTDGQAVEVVVVRKKQTIVQRAAGYWPTSQTQKVQEFVRKTYLLGDASTGRNLGIQRHLQREYNILRTIEHPYIVRLTDFEIISTPAEGTKAYLYTPYCSYGDLSPYVGAGQIWETRPTLSTSQFWQIFRQLSSALLYCQYGISTWQEKGLVMDPNWSGAIFHRDIKPANVVISELTDQEIKVKLCDFGYSRLVSSRVSGSFVGTHGYIAPEITEYSQNWTEKCDIYSLGRTMFALLLYLPILEEEKNEIRLKFEDCFHAKPECRPKILHIFEITTAEVYKKESFHVNVSEYLQADKLPLLASLHQAGMRLGQQLFQDNENREHLRLLRVLFLDSTGPPATRWDHLRPIRRWLLQRIFTCALMRYKAFQGGSQAVHINPKIQAHQVTDAENLYDIQHLTFDHAPQDNSKDDLQEQIDAQIQLETQAGPDELLRATQVVLEAQIVSHNPSSPERQAVLKIPAVSEIQVVPTHQPDEHSQTELASWPEHQVESQLSHEIQVKPNLDPDDEVEKTVYFDAHGGEILTSQDAQADQKTQPSTDIQTNASADLLADQIRPSQEAQVNPTTLPNADIQTDDSANPKESKDQSSQDAQVDSETQPTTNIRANASAKSRGGKVQPSPEARLRPEERRRESIRDRPESRVLVNARSEAQTRPKSAPIAPITSPFLRDVSNYRAPLVTSYSALETTPRSPVPDMLLRQPIEVQHRSRIHVITPPEILTESVCLKKLTTYSTFLIRKTAPVDPEKEPRGTWARAEITERSLNQEEIIEEIRKLNESRRSVVDKKKTLMPNQQGQVNAIIENLESAELDSAFEWSLVQLDSVTQPVRVLDGGVRRRGREMRETVTLTIFVKRAPRKDINPVALYTSIEHMNNTRKLEIESGRLPQQLSGSGQKFQPAVTSDPLQFPSWLSYPSNSATYEPAGQRGQSIIINIPKQSENRGYPITYSEEQLRTDERRERRDSPRSYSAERRRPIITETPRRNETRDHSRPYAPEQQSQTQEPQLQYGTYGAVPRPSYGLPEPHPQTARLPQMYRSPHPFSNQMNGLRTENSFGPTPREGLPKHYGSTTEYTAPVVPSEPQHEGLRDGNDRNLRDERRRDLVRDPRRQIEKPGDKRTRSRKERRDDFERETERLYGSRTQSQQEVPRDWSDWQPPIPDPFSQKRDEHNQQGQVAEALRSYQYVNQVQSRNQSQEAGYVSYDNGGLSLRKGKEPAWYPEQLRDVPFPFPGPGSENPQAVDPRSRDHRFSSIDVQNRTVDEIAASRLLGGNEEPGNHLTNYAGYTPRQARNEKLGNHLLSYSGHPLTQNTILPWQHLRENSSENYQFDERRRTSADPPELYLQEEIPRNRQANDRERTPNQNTGPRSRVEFGIPRYQPDNYPSRVPEWMRVPER